MPVPDDIHGHADKLGEIATELRAMNQETPATEPGEIIEVIEHCRAELKGHALWKARNAA